LKVDVGPGYRVYFGQDGPVIVILLCGGEKHGQDRDMATAREYWKDYKNRKRLGEFG
jgi:putative addiction module killer protein